MKNSSKNEVLKLLNEAIYAFKKKKFLDKKISENEKYKSLLNYINTIKIPIT